MKIKMTKMFMIAVAAIMFVACDGRAVGTNNNSNAAENALETFRNCDTPLRISNRLYEFIHFQ